MPNLDIIYDVTIVIRWDEIKPINRWFINLLEIFQWHITSKPYANESQLVTIVERSTKYVNDLFDARVSFLFSLSVNLYAASRHLWGSATLFVFLFFLTSESKIVEEVKVKPGRGFKRYFKQTENALIFANALRCRHFPQFSSWYFFETSTASKRSHYF